MAEIILCNLSDANQIINQKRTEWVYNVLESLGIPDEVVYCQDVFTFRGELSERGIFIENHTGNEEVDVYKMQWYEDSKTSGWLPVEKKHLIAQWKQPKRIRKVEGKDVYYEIHLNEWSMTKSKKTKGG